MHSSGGKRERKGGDVLGDKNRHAEKKWKGLSSITKAGRQFLNEILGKIRASAAVQQVEYINEHDWKMSVFIIINFFLLSQCHTAQNQ